MNEAEEEHIRLAHTMPLGDWFLTQSGKRFWPLSPDSDAITIEDIAHALSHVCRYGGHCNPFYSVAQHSVHVSYLVSADRAKLGLLHDATEAYVGDMVRPLKYAIPQYQAIEDSVWKAVAKKFSLPEAKPTLDADVKLADDIALMTERRDVMPKSDHIWSVKAIPDSERITALSSKLAKNLFLNRYNELFL